MLCLFRIICLEESARRLLLLLLNLFLKSRRLLVQLLSDLLQLCRQLRSAR